MTTLTTTLGGGLRFGVIFIRSRGVAGVDEVCFDILLSPSDPAFDGRERTSAEFGGTAKIETFDVAQGPRDAIVCAECLQEGEDLREFGPNLW